MRKVFLFLLLLFVSALVIVFYLFIFQGQSLVSPLGRQKEKPLLVYTFENLRQTKFVASAIMLGQKVDETTEMTTQVFYFSVPKTLNAPTTEIVSGIINTPKQPGIYPVIVMLRGYVPIETYQSGIGTQPTARVFAKNGFITLAPDFLGYGESASPSANTFEARFQSYTTALTLLASLTKLNEGLEASFSGKIQADATKVGIWGHSNGGQIALSVLAISGQPYPTVLWAPVSKSFPYSILAYTDEADDQGKALRQTLARFEEDYDTDNFSPPNYYQWIRAPIQIHQGEADQEVPVWWSNELVGMLKKDNIDIKYFTYPRADHNLRPAGWSSAVERSVGFYREYLR
jgi:dipeptidyl aminopeptidase/acylaminoacyl peptidase